MGWTLGTMLFYGGLAAAAATVVAAVITAIALAASKRKITRKLNEEYGGKLK